MKPSEINKCLTQFAQMETDRLKELAGMMESANPTESAARVLMVEELKKRGCKVEKLKPMTSVEMEIERMKRRDERYLDYIDWGKGLR